MNSEAYFFSNECKPISPLPRNAHIGDMISIRGKEIVYMQHSTWIRFLMWIGIIPQSRGFWKITGSSQ